MRYLLIMFFFVSCDGMAMHSPTLQDQQDHTNNLFRGARHNIPQLITHVLDAGISPDITRTTTPALEARLHSHYDLASLIERCKSPWNIGPTGSDSDWTMEKLNALYNDQSLYFHLLPTDKVARNLITTFLINETFCAYDQEEERIEALNDRIKKENSKHTLRKNQLEGSLYSGEQTQLNPISLINDQIKQISEQIAQNKALVKQKKHRLLQGVLEKALYTDAPFIQDVIRDLAKQSIYPTKFFGIQTEMIIPPKKLNPAADRFLFLGARLGNQRIVHYALNIGANVEAEEKITPLTEAVLYQKLSAVQTLVARGSDINYSAQRGGWSPLHYAALFSNQILEFLVQHPSSDPLKQTVDGQTPFSILCENSVQIINKSGHNLSKQIKECGTIQGYVESNTYHYDNTSETCYKIPQNIVNILWLLYLRKGIPSMNNYDEHNIASIVIKNPPEPVDPLLVAYLNGNKKELMRLLTIGTHDAKYLQRARTVALLRKDFLSLYLLGHDINDQQALEQITNQLYRICITGKGGTRKLLHVLTEKKEIKKSELEIALHLTKLYKQPALTRIIEFIPKQPQ